MCVLYVSLLLVKYGVLGVPEEVGDIADVLFWYFWSLSERRMLN